MTDDNSTPIADDESTVDNVRYETWTDRANGRAYVRADFSDIDADSPTLAEQPNSSADPEESPRLGDFEDGSLFGAGGIEVFTLDYAYYTGSEEVAPYPDDFTPDWALEAFRRHGYDVLDPDDPASDDGELISDGGDRSFRITATVTATLPAIGRKEFTFKMEVSDPSEANKAEAKDSAKNVVPDDATIEDVDVEVDEL